MRRLILAFRIVLVCPLILLAPVTTSSQEGPLPPGMAPLVNQALMQRAHTEGTVRVIVELGGMNVIPEGFVRDDVAIGAQRQDIAAAQAALRQALRGVPHRVTRQFSTVPLIAIEASPDALRVLESIRGPVVRVHEDKFEVLALAQSGSVVGAPNAWSRGADGTGTVVAILDTGVDRDHPFLAGKVVQEACFSTSGSGLTTTCPNHLDEQRGPGSAAPCAVPTCEHGTHVAGIAAGNGATAGQGFSGVARGAGIFAIQVFSRGTTSSACGGPPPCVGVVIADLIAALEHVYLLRGSYNLAAVNLSLGGARSATNCDGDPRKGIIDSLRAVGIATVAASGNDFSSSSISAPACISTVISVAATTKSDTVASFSNRASFLSVLAPGVDITSSVPGGDFGVMMGTSQAAPHVAGAFAILKQVAPGASVSQLLQALQVTGRPLITIGGSTKSRIQIDAALAHVRASGLNTFVAGFYQDVLGRQPEPAGHAAWVNALLANCNAGGFNALGVAFFDSEEFRTARPLSLNGLVTVLYRAFLDRDPEPGGLAHWAQQFRTERVALANQTFIPSPEFQALLPSRSDRTAVTTVVGRFYTEILGRSAEPAGLATWVDEVVATGDLEKVAVAFITSAEFEARPLTAQGYVTILYRAFLGRDPDAGGLGAWEGVLRDHLISVIHTGFIASPEFQSKAQQLCGS